MKPRIAIIADVKNWAWKRKADQLQRYLGDQFRIDVACIYAHPPDPLPKGADLYHTFEVFQVRNLPQGLPFVTGMTAHVWPTWEKQHGQGTVRKWAAAALAVHANSRLLEAEMRALLERPICYVPNGVDHHFFKRLRARPVGKNLVVGWVGKPNPRKGADVVADACRLVPNVELRAVQRTHRNALTPEQMREFYQELHVLCVASDMDGTPNPALEAAACGVAVVSNRIGNMPEFVVDGVNGRFHDRTVEGIAGVLRQLEPGAASRMGEAARATVEGGWTWQHMAPAYGRMWSGALEQKRRAA